MSAVRPRRPADFRFRRLDGRWLVSNDVGHFAWLAEAEFHLLADGALPPNHPRYEELRGKGFVRHKMPLPRLAEQFRERYAYLRAGPSLHIVIPTLRCNISCVYCHASAGSPRQKDLDMNLATAKRVVDTVFSSPNRNLAIEFQGGEPLLNWEVVKFIVEYAQEKNRLEKRSLMMSLVSNLLPLTDDKLNYLIEKKVGLCTSLDGTESVHNACRQNTHRIVIGKLKKAIREYRKRFDRYMPAALPTLTRHSLPHPVEIVDEYVSLGLEGTHLRPLNPLGFAVGELGRIGISPGEFLAFYRQAMDHILELNRQGTFFMERLSWIFLVKILTGYDPNFLDIRSPCGAGIGQVAYNYNGDVYTCDEGRMLAMQGDESFRMGNVFEHSYEELLAGEVVKTVCIASCLDGRPGCCECVYKPYCGVCPVVNYAGSGTLFPHTFSDFRCQVYTGVMDYLFSRLQDPVHEGVFRGWLDRKVNAVE